jgi:hypothetical protein
MAEDVRAALVAEYAESSLRQMGERRGVSWQAMQQILRRHEIPLRSRGGDCRRFQESEA